MKFRTPCGVIAAMALVACASNQPAQQPTTTGATQGGSENAAPSDTSGQMNQQPQTGASEQQGMQGQEGMQGQQGQQGMQGQQGQTNMQGQQGMQQGQMQQGMGGNVFTTDAQIASFTEAANKAEIEQGKLAVRKAKDPEVKAYAQMMVDDHGQAEKKQERLLSTLNVTPESTSVTSQLQTDAQSGMSSISSKTGTDFDKAYIDLQIKEHQQVIQTIDSQLLPVVRNADFKRELSTIRPKLEDHLRRAQTLQQKLNRM